MRMNYIPTIGLEIHAELKTQSKMFCACKNDPDAERPNIHICPICLAHPGPLPTINKEAVISVIRLGMALKGTISKKSHFDRKSYFYPDLPKGYQISQYDEPLVSDGVLHGIRVKRVHLEEDTGKLQHDNFSSFVDYNRAGVPLVELVTEPDIQRAEDAVRFAKELQRILRYIGISDADMERGQMRVEANISVRKSENDEYGTKVEVKNINSFKAVYDAIEYELERQEDLISKGGNVIQETRGWDEKKGITESQRSKESAHDYRYFPEPDLPEIVMECFDLEGLRNGLPELPGEKRERLVREYGIASQNIELLIDDKELSDYFEEAVSELKSLSDKGNVETLFHYLTSDLKGLMNAKSVPFSKIKIPPEHFAYLVAFVSEGKLSSRLAKDMLLKMFETGEDPEALMKKEDLKVIHNEDELTAIVKDIIDTNQKVVEDYRSGKTNALQFLIGQIMAKTKGKANPEILKKVLSDLLHK